MKALGVGLGAFKLRDVEVVRLASGAPTLRLHGAAARAGGGAGRAALARVAHPHGPHRPGHRPRRVTPASAHAAAQPAAPRPGVRSAAARPRTRALRRGGPHWSRKRRSRGQPAGCDAHDARSLCVGPPQSLRDLGRAGAGPQRSQTARRLAFWCGRGWSGVGLGPERRDHRLHLGRPRVRRARPTATTTCAARGGAPARPAPSAAGTPCSGSTCGARSPTAVASGSRCSRTSSRRR